MDRFNTALEPLWLFLHKGHVIRRAVLFIAVWMAVDSWLTAKGYLFSDGADAALLVASLGPPNLLLGAALKFYSTGRNNQNAKPDN